MRDAQEAIGIVAGLAIGLVFAIALLFSVLGGGWTLALVLPVLIALLIFAMAKAARIKG